MSKEELLLFDLVDYMYYLDSNNKSANWNKGYFRRLKKLLQLFCKEYYKNRGWY